MLLLTDDMRDGGHVKWLAPINKLYFVANTECIELGAVFANAIFIEAAENAFHA